MSSISELTLKLILILIPGAISWTLFDILASPRERTTFQHIVYIILFGGISYIAAQLLWNICGSDTELSNFWKNLSTKEIPFNAIIKATLASILVGFIAVTIDYYKLINKLGNLLKISDKYGDENLYTYYLNSKDVNEIYVRDIKNNLTYQGKIRSFSETKDCSEMVLEQVSVFFYETSEHLYDLDQIYLSYPKNNLIIEVPYFKGEQNAKSK